MRETSLTAWHRQHRAKMMEFGGFSMPVDYGGIIEEHNRVRRDVGIFDVSHMGEFFVSGHGAAAFLDYLVTNRPSSLELGQALYTPMCYPDGGTVDDLLIYRVDPERYMLVVNAGNTDKDWNWISQMAVGWDGVSLENVSADTALIAVQGPTAKALLAPRVSTDLNGMAYYHAAAAKFNGLDLFISRTGYTGEDGFELYLPASNALAVWERLIDAGAGPVGLGARDTLRLEARLPLYEHELTPEISPLEAGLAPFVKLDKEDFVGKEALARQKAEGLKRRIVGLTVDGGIARPGYPVRASVDGQVIGRITSGTKSPTLGQAIALALLDIASAKVGTPLWVEIRGRTVPARVVKTPFYRRAADS